MVPKGLGWHQHYIDVEWGGGITKIIEGEHNVPHYNERNARSWPAFWPPDQTMEPEDEALYIRCPQQNLYH